MKQSIKNAIYLAISENKWLDIEYVNVNKEKTNYYIGIKDIDIERGHIYCDIFNPYKDEKCINKDDLYINISGIIKADIIEQSFYETPSRLTDKFNASTKLGEYLEIDRLDNNILCYLSDAYKLDTDPYLKESIQIDGIDIMQLGKEHVYKLNDHQFLTLLDKVFKTDKNSSEKLYRKQDLAINSFSIDVNDKQYVVAYRSLTVNFKNRTLVMAEKSTINKSFLIEEDKKVTLGMYLDMNPEEFCANYDTNKREYIELLKENFHNGEKVNTRPSIFLINRSFQKGVDVAFEAISEMDKQNELTQPLKSFFGRNRSGTGTSKDPNIVVFNKSKINIDQMRVVYNSMVNHVTFVKGPPGTGKTETIFNVLLSAYANDKKVLVCSNNNHPVNDIFDKMTHSLCRKSVYSDKTENILFPIMRLGNNKEMAETLNKLRDMYIFAKSKVKTHVKEEATETSKNKSMASFKELRELLKEYEDIQELKEKIEKLESMKSICISSNLQDELNKQIEVQRNKLDGCKYIKNEDVTKYALSAQDDSNFQNFLYYSSLLRILKLLSPVYKDLIDILNNPNNDAAVIALNKYLKDDKNLRRFTDIFPIIVCTNISCDKLGSPKPQFDLCIMDEAGQCNIATSIIPIIRATDLLLVGDTNQLQPVTVIESDVNDNLLLKYSISNEYDYVKNSILSTMLRKDNNSKSILLRYHYRCGQGIANFVNSRFYEKQLKLINTNPGQLNYVNVKNTIIPASRNSYKEEAMAIVDLIKKNNYKDVGIVTPFVNQASLINDYLDKSGIKDVKAGTIHTLQGSERSVIIMSSALSVKTGKKTMDWVKNNHELINVAVTRAKESFIFVGDKEAIDILSKEEEQPSDIKALSDYVYSKGTISVPKSEVTISSDFSNNSKSEKEFFDTVAPYFNARKTFKIERNVPVRKAINSIKEDEMMYFGKKEFDFIVQITAGLLKNRLSTIIVFEIDGGEHVGSSRTAYLDREKEAICKFYGIKLIRIANNQVKDYELIIRLFESIIKNVPDIDSQAIQLSLFD